MDEEAIGQVVYRMEQKKNTHNSLHVKVALYSSRQTIDHHFVCFLCVVLIYIWKWKHEFELSAFFYQINSIRQ